jgi:hypothetical protein
MWRRTRTHAGGGGHAAHSNPNDYVTYGGLTLKKPPSGEYALSKVIGATMWCVVSGWVGVWGDAARHSSCWLGRCVCSECGSCPGTYL